MICSFSALSRRNSSIHCFRSGLIVLRLRCGQASPPPRRRRSRSTRSPSPVGHCGRAGPVRRCRFECEGCHPYPNFLIPIPQNTPSPPLTSRVFANGCSHHDYRERREDSPRDAQSLPVRRWPPPAVRSRELRARPASDPLSQTGVPAAPPACGPERRRLRAGAAAARLARARSSGTSRGLGPHGLRFDLDTPRPGTSVPGSRPASSGRLGSHSDQACCVFHFSGVPGPGITAFWK